MNYGPGNIYAPVGSPVGYFQSLRGIADLQSQDEGRQYRFAYFLSGFTPGTLMGAATITFSWRIRTISTSEDGLTTSYTYSDVVTATLDLSDEVSGTVATGWYTLSSVPDDPSVSVIGPGDPSFIQVQAAIVQCGAVASKLQGGFLQYAGHASDPTAVYNVETATAAPGSAAAYSGSQQINLTPGANIYVSGPSYPPLINSFTANVGLYASLLYGSADVAASVRTGSGLGSGQLDSVGLLTKTPTVRQFANGLIMTLSAEIETGTVSADVSDYLATLMAYNIALWAYYEALYDGDPPPLEPTLPLAVAWTIPAAASSGMPATFQFSQSEIARNWLSLDEVQLELLQSMFSIGIGFLPMDEYQSVTAGEPDTYVYNAGAITILWDQVTTDLVTGAQTVTPQSTDVSLDTTPSANPYPYSAVTNPYPDYPFNGAVYGPVTTDLPDPGTSIRIENVRVAPGFLPFLLEGPSYEIMPGR